MPDPDKMEVPDPDKMAALEPGKMEASGGISFRQHLMLNPELHGIDGTGDHVSKKDFPSKAEFYVFDGIYRGTSQLYRHFCTCSAYRHHGHRRSLGIISTFHVAHQTSRSVGCAR